MKRRRRIRDNDKQRDKGAGIATGESPLLELIIGGGVGGVFLLAFLVGQQARWTLTVLDGIFWSMAAAAVVARLVVVSKARDKPAPGGRWLPLVVGLGLVGAVWLAAQAMGGEPS